MTVRCDDSVHRRCCSDSERKVLQCLRLSTATLSYSTSKAEAKLVTVVVTL